MPQEGPLDFTLRDVFDVPDLSTTNDDIVNGTYVPGRRAAACPVHRPARRLFAGPAVALHRHRAEHFQNHVLFTNYQFYVAEFEAYARASWLIPTAAIPALSAPEMSRSPTATRHR